MKTLFPILFFLITSFSVLYGQPTNGLFSSNNPRTILKEINKSNLSYQDIINEIWNISYPRTDSGLYKYKSKCIDGNLRNYFIYVPDNYNSKIKTPVLVYLHGGVTISKSIPDYNINLTSSIFRIIADDLGFLLLCPIGDNNATWWDKTGISNLLNQLKETKTNFNVDDNRIYLCGFSDGGSGTFFHSMILTEYFAGFIALNGHPTVGSHNSIYENFVPNLYNTNLKVVNTDIDELYPAHNITPLIDLLRKSNGNIQYTIYNNIGHTFEYAKKEFPHMKSFLINNTRNPHPDSIIWETSNTTFGKYHWLSIDKIDASTKENWHKDINMSYNDSSCKIDFIPYYKSDNDGIKIKSMKNKYPLQDIFSLQEDDRIIQINNIDIHSYSQISILMNNLDRTKKINLAYIRDSNKFIISRYLPEFRTRTYFERELSSAKINASYLNNTFIISSSRVKRLTVFINPEYVDLSKKIKIIINNKEYYNDFIETDYKYFIENYFHKLDKKQLYINKLSFKL
jgi:hypothetical protein